MEATMKAILIREAGGPDQLTLGTFARPVPAADELLVRVRATAVNRADTMQRQGKYPPPPGASPLLGLEVSGIVEEKGADCSGWEIGDHIFGLMGGGGYAEYAVLHRDLAMHMPTSLTFEEAAAVPEVFLTAYQTLYWFGRLQAGDHVLIHAAASGVGTAAIQLVKQAGGLAYATASAGKLDFCRSLGAVGTIDYTSEDFAARTLELTDGHGADIIVDFIGAPYLAQNLQTIALDGRIVLLATLGGTRLDSFDLRPLFRKRASIHATTLRSRTKDYQARLTREFADYALPLFERGELKPVIDTVFDWSDVAEAHHRMERNENIGKIVLRVEA